MQQNHIASRYFVGLPVNDVLPDLPIASTIDDALRNATHFFSKLQVKCFV